MYQFETHTVAISTGTYLFTNLLKWAYKYIFQEKLKSINYEKNQGDLKMRPPFHKHPS